MVSFKERKMASQEAGRKKHIMKYIEIWKEMKWRSCDLISHWLSQDPTRQSCQADSLAPRPCNTNATKSSSWKRIPRYSEYTHLQPTCLAFTHQDVSRISWTELSWPHRVPEATCWWQCTQYRAPGLAALFGRRRDIRGPALLGRHMSSNFKLCKENATEMQIDEYSKMM